MYVAFLIVSPIDQGPSLSRFVKRAIRSIEESGISYQVTPMGTVMESENLDEIFKVARDAAESIRNEGARRISLSLKVDMRFDKDISIRSKMDAINYG